MDEVEKLGEDIAATAVLEYDTVRMEAAADASYMSIEPASIAESLKQRIESAKDSFRKIRGEIAEGKYGEIATMEVNEELSAVKDA